MNMKKKSIKVAVVTSGRALAVFSLHEALCATATDIALLT